MMQKMGSQYKAIHNNQYLQKTNRFYASIGKDSAYLYKEKGKTREHVLKESGVSLFNDYREVSDINYQYYIKKAQEIIDLIEPKQMVLWS
jgi:hypothetical protein